MLTKDEMDFVLKLLEIQGNTEPITVAEGEFYQDHVYDFLEIYKHKAMRIEDDNATTN